MLSFWRILISLSILTAVMLSSCSSARKHKKLAPAKETSEPYEVENKQEVEDKTLEPQFAQSELSKSSIIKSQEIVYVASGGLARAFAHVGILKELERARLSPVVFVGVGYGGLIAAIYCDSSSINEFEWKILKLKNEVFYTEMSEKSRLDKISKYVNEIFGDKKITQLKKPLYIGYKTKLDQYMFFSKDVKLSEQIVSALAHGETKLVHKVTPKPTPVHFAKNLNKGVLLSVNTEVSDEPQWKMISDFYLAPELGGVKVEDFEKIMAISYKGERSSKSVILEMSNKIMGVK